MENFYLTNELNPFIYTINVVTDKSNDSKSVLLSPDRQKFELPEKLYGDVDEEAHHVFGYYVFNNKETQGSLFIGDAGAGKTLLAERICNVAIENQVPVIYIHSQPEENAEAIVKWLGGVHDCVVYIDEFGKQFKTWIQDKLLTTLSDKSKKVLWVLTENSTGRINSFIINRPGRSHYQYVFNKIKESVVVEYCADNGVDKFFTDKILDKLNKSTEFTFDHLRGIVNEYHYCLHRIKQGSPESIIDIDKFIDRLNIKHLSSKFSIVLYSCKLKGNNLDPMVYSFRFSSPTFKIYRSESTHDNVTERTYRNILESPSSIKYEFNITREILQTEIGKKVAEEDSKFKEMIENMSTKDLTKLKPRGETQSGKYGEIVFSNDYFEIRLVLIDEL